MTDPSPATVTLAALDAVTASLPGAEERPGQRRMAELVAESIARGRHLVVQAGTGTGKTLAYLVPAIVSGKRTIVATATKALQDQLATKDLPFLAAELAETGHDVDEERRQLVALHPAERAALQRLLPVRVLHGELGEVPAGADHPGVGGDHSLRREEGAVDQGPVPRCRQVVAEDPLEAVEGAGSVHREDRGRPRPGHGPLQLTVPLGTAAELGTGVLTLLEPPLTPRDTTARPGREEAACAS